jgi:hypothetical protein
LLKKDQGYNLTTIKEERLRIDARLKEKGFYYFAPDYLKVQVDSTVADHQVDLKVKETPLLAQTIASTTYYRISIIPLMRIALLPQQIQLKHNDITIIDPENIFKPVSYFLKKMISTTVRIIMCLNRLVNLGTFKFVKNQFKVADTIGNYLDAYYYPPA